MKNSSSLPNSSPKTSGRIKKPLTPSKDASSLNSSISPRKTLKTTKSNPEHKQREARPSADWDSKGEALSHTARNEPGVLG